jgi:hypothetical protein
MWSTLRHKQHRGCLQVTHTGILVPYKIIVGIELFLQTFKKKRNPTAFTKNNLANVSLLRLLLSLTDLDDSNMWIEI